MSKPWDFVKAFESKTFEQNSKETNNSIPVSKMEEAAKLIEETVVLNKALEKAGVSIAINQETLDNAWKSATKIMGADAEKILVEAAKQIDAYVILPPEKPVVEVVVPVEKPKKKQKGKKNEKRKRS